MSYFARLLATTLFRLPPMLLNPNTGDRNASLMVIVIAALIVSGVLILVLALSSRRKKKK